MIPARTPNRQHASLSWRLFVVLGLAISGGAPASEDAPTPAPRYLPYTVEAPAPEGYVRGRQPHRGLLIAGGVTFGLPFLAGVVTGSVRTAQGSTDAWPHFIPLAGPWIDLGMGPSDEPGGFGLRRLGPKGQVAENIIEGVVQLGGAVMLGLGAAGRPAWVRAPVSLGVAPGPHGARVVLAGTL